MEMISFDAIVEDGVIKIPERLRSSLPSGARVTVETTGRAEAEDDGRVGPFSNEIDDADLVRAVADESPLSFEMIMKLTRALGLRLCVAPIEGAEEEDRASAAVSLPPAV